MTKEQNRLRSRKTLAWLQLLRVSNLFTVPGDPLAGAVLALIVAWSEGEGIGHRCEGLALGPTCWNVLWAMLASLLLYAAGLLSNDYFDLEEDRRQRPGRPLPSGRVSPRTAILVALALALGGIALGCAAGGTMGVIVAAALVIAIFAYNAFVKPVPVLGPLNMGLCRGLSVLLGASASGIVRHTLSPLVLVFAAGLGLYIAAVTAVAARETRQGPVGPRRFGPLAGMFAWIISINLAALPYGVVILAHVPASVLQVLAIGWTIACVAALKGSPGLGSVPRTVGKLIRGLLLVQACMVAVGAGLWTPAWGIAAILLIFWPLSAVLGKRLYAS
jgi:4-hydroxybenzoate polyprenyltransferase